MNFRLFGNDKAPILLLIPGFGVSYGITGYLIMHGADAHSRYFGEAAYHYMVDGKADGYKTVVAPNPCPENKELLIIPDASHCDLYDGGF